MTKNIFDPKRENKLKEEIANFKKYRESNIFGSTIHRIIKGDSRKMSNIKNNDVDLIVTSPPYYNAKEYIQWDSLDAYSKDMRDVMHECIRVLKPGRKFCLNISDIPTKGDSGVKWLPLGSTLLKEAEKVGFELADRIFWFKTPVKGFNYGSLPFPPSPLICDSIEYLYVLRKPGKSVYSHISQEQKHASKLSREEYMEYTKQIWSIPRVRINDNLEGHIAPFPLELPLRCIKLYSFVQDTVLDPFAGSGTTTIAAAKLKRNSIMYEIKKEYIELFKNRVNTSTKDLFTDPSFVYEK